ncbi:30S ribosomal protein S11 [Candidatus Woesebacteria bacterium]|jgi:small subunit ribosomal protein S11|nr:30S ribosomal protein S11 [Candidatus Woesebacteria bacterium]HNV45335.1 30S ribosomal protein S11 [Candidatus Woesebacteria bacterium]HOA11922.1 30S ribosomal protein S11 [Candidatus Woesebacteria bacterium]HOI05154.1 30S ribosomal protein S11 [Candidatus Woesebacteria bacterium]HOP39103.1 30S ribosomal protein S11 [Candidatus Woesebacteria bacterium]
MAVSSKKTTTKKKKSNYQRATKIVPKGRLYVSATFNNTIVSVTDEKGNVLCWESTGGSGFSGSRKSTPYAATITVENAINKAKNNYGMNQMEVYLKGPGPGRDVALRVLRAQGIGVALIADLTPVPHNGTRPRKARN